MWSLTTGQQYPIRNLKVTQKWSFWTGLNTKAHHFRNIFRHRSVGGLYLHQYHYASAPAPPTYWDMTLWKSKIFGHIQLWTATTDGACASSNWKPYIIVKRMRPPTDYTINHFYPSYIRNGQTNYLGMGVIRLQTRSTSNIAKKKEWCGIPTLFKIISNLPWRV